MASRQVEDFDVGGETQVGADEVATCVLDGAVGEGQGFQRVVALEGLEEWLQVLHEQGKTIQFQISQHLQGLVE